VNCDFSLMDELFSLLERETEIQPITCGYFNKIVVSLLGKIKRKMLFYLLIRRKGDVYLKLLALLEHHSLCSLLIELLYLKVTPATPSPTSRDQFSSDFDKDDKADKENGQEGEEEEEEKRELDPTEGMSDLEKEMHFVLSQRKQEVVARLIHSLTSQNKDAEKCLNAHYVLSELADNETTYGKLVERENLT